MAQKNPEPERPYSPFDGPAATVPPPSRATDKNQPRPAPRRDKAAPPPRSRAKVKEQAPDNQKTTKKQVKLAPEKQIAKKSAKQTLPPPPAPVPFPQGVPEPDFRQEVSAAPSPAKKSKMPFKVKLLFYIIVLGFVLLVVLSFATYREDLDNNMFDRLFAGIEWPFGEKTVTETFVFDGHLQNQYIDYKGGLAVLSPKRLVVYDSSGKEVFGFDLNMVNPALSRGHNHLVAYDRGGNRIVVLNNYTKVLDEMSENMIYSVSMNDAGWFAAITAERGYKGLVTVFGPSMKPVYRWHSGGEYLIDASVSPDGKRIAVAVAGQTEQFYGGLILLSLDSEEPVAQLAYPQVLPLSVDYKNNNRVILVCEDRCFVYDTAGQIQGNFLTDDRVLLGFSTDVDDGLILYLGTASGLSKGQLLSLDMTAEVIATENTPDDIIGFAAAGEGVTLLTGENVYFYDLSLTLTDKLDNETEARQVIVLPNGESLIIGANAALFCG